MRPKQPDDQYSSEEAARRRDAVVKAMIKMPPTPQKPLGKKNKRASRRGRASPPRQSA